MRKKTTAAIAAATMLLPVLAACGSDSGSGKEGTGASPLKIGVMAALTGYSSETFKVTPKAVEARFKTYEKAGGKCASRGFDLIEADDTNAPEGALKVARKLVQQDQVDVILQATAAFYGAAQFLTTDSSAKKIPVLGGGFDGSPVYYDTTNNVFATFPPTDFTKTYDNYGKLMKEKGVTSAAVMAYDNPSSTQAGDQAVRSIEAAGIKVGYANVKIPNGTTDVGAIVRGMIDNKVDGIASTLNPETAFAVLAALRQGGQELKFTLLPVGYGADLLKSEPAVQAAQNVTFSTAVIPAELHTPAADALGEALKEYTGNASGIPSFAEGQGWLAADMLIYALEKAGCDADSAAIMKALRTDGSWDGGGLLSQPRDFGSAEPAKETCSFYVTLKDHEFVPDYDEAFCGDEVKQ